jgi:hypothetical protein
MNMKYGSTFLIEYNIWKHKTRLVIKREVCTLKLKNSRPQLTL